MRRRLGVAHEDDVVLDPTFVGDARKVAPDRAIDQQAVALQLLGEDALQKLRRLLLVELVEPGLLVGLGLHLEDPGRAIGLVLIGMRDEDAVLGFAEEKRKRIERAGRAHPGKLVGPEIELSAEMLLVSSAD